MKRAKVIVPWQEGLHARPAARLVSLAQRSKSAIFLKVGSKVADARSIIALMLLSAGSGTVVDLEACGEDEETALNSITSMFNGEIVSASKETTLRAAGA